MSYRNSFFANIPPVVKNLLAINVIFFLASMVLPRLLTRFGVNVTLEDVLGLHYWQAPHFNAAQLLSYSFMHGGFMHLFFNMLSLIMFGPILEQVWGSRRFFFYYIITAIGAAVVQEVVWTIELPSMVRELCVANGYSPVLAFDEVKTAILANPNFITVGASGAVFGILLAFGWLFPEQIIYIYFFPVKARLGVLIFGLMEVFFGVANFSGDHVAHFAHLGGMIFGALLILYWKKYKKIY